MTTYQIFQRADGIQYACQNETAVYYRPHRCASWVRTSVVIDFDFFSLVGEDEVTDVSEEAPVFNGQNASDVSFYFQAMRYAEYPTPTEEAHQAALVMNEKSDSRRDHFEELQDEYDDAISDRNVMAARAIKGEMIEVAAADHAEALAMNAALDVEYASIDQHVPTEEAKPRFKTVAAHFIVGAPRTF